MNKGTEYMKRAFELAIQGLGACYPNPMVGCVIVHEDKIIGEGWHQKAGEGHAEVNAIHQVKDKSLLREATVYVTLEPCSHYGKTPPCADLLSKYPVKKIIVANHDPNPLVAGKGIRKLKEAGIEVETGLLEEIGLWINRRFFTFIQKKRPYIILKWAETEDGFISRKNYDSKWISNPDSRKLVHKWRSEEQAILVGRNTAEKDNPSLNVRLWQGNNPIRILIDRKLKLNSDLTVFDQKQRTICFNELKECENNLIEYIKLDAEKSLVNNVTEALYQRQIQSVIIEGGAQVLDIFIKENNWDEARIFRCPQNFGEGIKAPFITGSIKEQAKIEKDTLTLLTNTN